MTSIEAINQACAKALDSLIKTKTAERNELKAKLDTVQAEIDDLSSSYNDLTVSCIDTDSAKISN
jgi:hypothetical protein